MEKESGLALNATFLTRKPQTLATTLKLNTLSSVYHVTCVPLLSQHQVIWRSTSNTNILGQYCKRCLIENKVSLKPILFFPDPNDAVWSLITSLPEGIFACSVCSHTSRNKRAMYEHVESKHTKSPGYPCSLCPGRVCPSLNALRSHSVRHHGSSRGFVPK